MSGRHGEDDEFVGASIYDAADDAGVEDGDDYSSGGPVEYFDRPARSRQKLVRLSFEVGQGADEDGSHFGEIAQWADAERSVAREMTEAGVLIGRLDEAVKRSGLQGRIRLQEVGDLLWRAGYATRPEWLAMQRHNELGVSADRKGAYRLAAWVDERLERGFPAFSFDLNGGAGVAAVDDLVRLRAFLGREYSREAILSPYEDVVDRPTGDEADAAMVAWLRLNEEAQDLHALTRGIFLARDWRGSAAASREAEVEAAVIAAKLSVPNDTSRGFVPVSFDGKRTNVLRSRLLSPEDALKIWLNGLIEAVRRSLHTIQAIENWTKTATERVEKLKGSTPAAIIRLIAEDGVVSSPMLKHAAGIDVRSAGRALLRVGETGVICECPDSSQAMRYWQATL